MGHTLIRNGSLHKGGGKRKKKRAIKSRPARWKRRRVIKRRPTCRKKKQKGALGALAAIDAQVGSQVIGGLIDKIF